MSLQDLIEKARSIKMSTREREVQRVSFAYGNASITNKGITRELVRRQAVTESTVHIPTVAIDLDGTLAEYEGWKGENHIGDPRPGAVEGMQIIKKTGAKILIWTTRGNTKAVADWLKKHSIPYDHINHNPDQPDGASDKVIADVYLDDKAVSAKDLKKGINEVLQILKNLDHRGSKQASPQYQRFFERLFFEESSDNETSLFFLQQRKSRR